MKVSVRDRMEISDSRRTSDGFLATKGRISRTGLYTYHRGELNLDGNPNDEVQIYRGEDAVFSDESMATFAHRPLTLNHPPVMVDASNWKRYAVGQAGNKVRRDGEFVEVDMLLLDSAAISAVENGAMISPGYVAEVEMTSGTTPDGQHFDGRMVGPFKANHIAVLTGRGRGGPECRLQLGDAWPVEDSPEQPQKENRTVKTILVDSVPFNQDNLDGLEAAVKKVEDRAANAETALAYAQTKAATDAVALADAQAQVATLTAEKATLAAELADARDPAKLRDAAAEYAAIADKARKLGVEVADTDSVATIKANAVKAKVGDAAASFTDAQFDAAFATLSVPTDAKPDAFRQSMAARDSASLADAMTESQKAYAEKIAAFAA